MTFRIRALVFAVAVAAVSLAGVSAQTPAASDRIAKFLQSWDAVPRVNPGVPANGAKVLIVKFHDYLCPHCKAMHYALKPILDRYERTNPGAVRQVVKDFPLNTNCNPSITQTLPGHEASCEAAAAVRMARPLGKADAMEEWLWQNQETLTVVSVKYGAARLLGINDFDQRYAALLPDIKKDAAAGGALHVGGTPNYIVNGVQFEGSYPADLIDAGIDHELKKALAIR